MLFVSCSPNFQKTGIIQEEAEYHPMTGKFLKINPGVDAEFTHGGVPSWAMEQALENPQFLGHWGGLPENVNPATYVSRYDTDKEAAQKNWDDETKTLVEHFLLNQNDYGDWYVKVDPPSVRMEEPWRGYDNTHHKKIHVIAKELDPESQRYALEYEVAHKNRAEVVGFLAEIVGEPEEVVAA